MAAYAVVDVEIRDIEAYLAYQKAASTLLEAAGARYLARGGECRVFAGNRASRRLIIVEFPSLSAMEEFFESDGYRALEAQRLSCSRARIVGVEGL
jgi:uncharacterized protein (DUF1330 family)